MNLSQKIQQFQNQLIAPVDASSLGLFRILFGGLMVYQSFCVFNTAFIDENYIKAYFHFPYTLFDVFNFEKLPPNLMRLLFLAMGLSSIGILTGLCFRTSAVVFFVTFLYAFLFEKGLYHAHYYLILLIVFLLLISHAHRWPALNTLRLKKIKESTIPFWQLFLLRAQFIIVYFYAAFNKIDYDWLLRAQPLQAVLATKQFLGHPLTETWIGYMFSWGGFLLDLTIFILLFLGRYRLVALGCILIFNLTNHWIFSDINTFPFLMIASMTLFVDPDAPKKFIETLHSRIKIPRVPVDLPAISQSQTLDRMNPVYRRFIFGFVVVYLAVQILVPLRRFLYPSNTNWTMEGVRFAWRLKMNNKKVKYTIVARDAETGKTYSLDHYQEVLTPYQLWLDATPDMLVQYAHYLKKEAEYSGIKNPSIYVHAEASLNSRPFQPFIDERVNLADVDYPLFSHASWIIPLRKP